MHSQGSVMGDIIKAARDTGYVKDETNIYLNLIKNNYH